MRPSPKRSRRWTGKAASLQRRDFLVGAAAAALCAPTGALARGAPGGGTPAEQLRGYGRFALEAETVPEPERIAVIESRLPSREWPVTPTRLTAVDCVSGELAVFDAAWRMNFLRQWKHAMQGK